MQISERASVNFIDFQYHSLVDRVLRYGQRKSDRTGTGVTSLFGQTFSLDLAKGFPLLTTKKLHFKSIALELIWFLQGRTDVAWLQERGVSIWDEWELEDGTIGEGSYGRQWRNFNGVDQITNVIKSIKEDPFSRRHIVSAWNPAEVANAALPPCHVMFQFNVSPSNRLSCMLTMRSNDIGLGCPYNIASYALLTHIIANICDLHVGKLVISIGDAHIYNNHLEPLKEQMARESFPAPSLQIRNKLKSVEDLTFEDFDLIGYRAHPNIKMDVSV